MKTIRQVVTLILCMLMLVPFNTFAYVSSVVPNPDVDMPKSTPYIDGNVEEDGTWSSKVDVNDATLGRFWAANPPTSTAKVYFAYDETNLYFAADIVDKDSRNGFIVSTGYDDIDNDGETRDYGFNGDVMTLMLDALGVFNDSNSYTPWYNIGIFADNSVKVYRSQYNEADITANCVTAGKITADGWKFEVQIPWSVISADFASAGKSVSVSKLSSVGSVSRAAVMYMDRHKTASGENDTWGRFITVCDKTADGTSGTSTSGTTAKCYGIKLNHVKPAHYYSDWKTVKEPTCAEDGMMERVCSDCGGTQTQSIDKLGHIEGESESVEATCETDGSYVLYCERCEGIVTKEVKKKTGHSMSDWYAVIDLTDVDTGIMEKACSACDNKENKNIPFMMLKTFVYVKGNVEQPMAGNLDALKELLIQE